MNKSRCNYCNKPIVLVPSAAQRAAKPGSTLSAADYIKLFTAHAECQVKAWYVKPMNGKST